MKRKLRKFFLEKKDVWITLKDLQTMFMYMKKNDRVVINRHGESFVFTYDSVELGSTDGEWFHTVMNRTPVGVIVVPEMKAYLKETIGRWRADLEGLYKLGLKQEHPLYKPCDTSDYLEAHVRPFEEVIDVSW